MMRTTRFLLCIAAVALFCWSDAHAKGGRGKGGGKPGGGVKAGGKSGWAHQLHRQGQSAAGPVARPGNGNLSRANAPGAKGPGQDGKGGPWNSRRNRWTGDTQPLIEGPQEVVPDPSTDVAQKLTGRDNALYRQLRNEQRKLAHRLQSAERLRELSELSGDPQMLDAAQLMEDRALSLYQQRMDRITDFRDRFGLEDPGIPTLLGEPVLTPEPLVPAVELP